MKKILSLSADISKISYGDDRSNREYNNSIDEADDSIELADGKMHVTVDLNNNNNNNNKSSNQPRPGLSRFYSNPYLLSFVNQKDENNQSQPFSEPHLHYGATQSISNMSHIHPNGANRNPINRSSNNLPTNVRDAYIDTIKTHFFYLGLSSGSALQMFLVSFIIMIVSTLSNAGPIRELSHEYYSVFRGIFLISFFFTLWGALIFIWRRAKIDYVNVLNVSYAHTYQYILRVSTTIAYIIFSNFMLYILTITGAFDSIASRSSLKHLWPALSIFIPISLILNPFDSITFPCFGVKRNGFKQRWGLIKEVFQIMISPFSKITMLRILIADCICSMPLVLPDIQYTACLYITGEYKEVQEDWTVIPPIPHSYYVCGKGNSLYFTVQLLLAFAPFWIRTLQCFRQYYDSNYTNYNTLFNALKYFISMSLTGLAAANSLHGTQFLKVLWITNGIIATCYSYYWDVVMDWGLGNFSSKHFLLRDVITFSPSVYYIAIVLDFIFRLGWSFVISPSQPYLRQHIILVLAAIEIIRRCIWAIIRVEYEYTKKLITEHTAQRDSKMNKISRNDLVNNHHIFEFREVNQNDDDSNDNDTFSYNHHNRMLNYKQNDSTNSLIVLNINDLDETNEF